MAVRVLLLFISVSIFIAGCKNEPYETGALSITTLANKESGGTTLTFGYRAGKLWKFNSKTTTATLANMIFYYRAGQLDHITSDSTGVSFKRVKVHYDGLTATDSTFLYATDQPIVDGDTLFVITKTTLTATRVVTYDDNENPVQVKTQTWTDNILTDEKVDITWEGGNVSRLFTTTNVNGAVSLKDVIANYDDKNSIYTRRKEYLYTLASKDFFWLSSNNPVVFNDGTGEKFYSYSYNKLGYPSNYTSNVGTKYGMTYSQIK